MCLRPPFGAGFALPDGSSVIALARRQATVRWTGHAGRRPPLEVLTHPEVLQTITAQHVQLCPANGSAEMHVPQHLLNADASEEYTLAEMVGFFSG
jgi:hypothetical protein